ncbi:hypothetical protein EG831_12200, partial [bacterium]|nr:hypothetical protein [bacterium]
MKNFTCWASREYPLPLRVLGTLPAGILFVYLIPLMLIRLGPRLDALLHWPRLALGAGNLIAGGLLVVLGAFVALWSIVAQFSL